MTYKKGQLEKPHRDDFTTGKEIGQGNFSRVFRVHAKGTKESYALKVMEKQHIHRLRVRHKNIFNEIQMEKQVLNALQHDNIVTLYHTFQDTTCLYFLMEDLKGGELWDRLMFNEKCIGCDESQSRFWAADLILSMEYMHQMQIVHRDLKPENCILRQNDGHLRVADFGTAKNLKDVTLNGPNFVGTPEYMPPEVVNNKDADGTADLWSLGIILYQMLAGSTPFQGGSQYLTFLKTQEGIYEMPPFFSKNAADLINQLLRPVPEDRLGSGPDGFTQLKKHPFFDGIDFESHNDIHTTCPIPTLQYACRRAVMSHITDVFKSNPTALQNMTHLPTVDQEHMMHLLERNQILHHPDVYALFFKDRPTAIRQYAKNHQYRGATQDVNGVWDSSFFFVQMSDFQFGQTMDGLQCTETSALECAIEHLNRIQPSFVVVGGNMTYHRPGEVEYEAEIHQVCTILGTLDPSIRIMFVAGESELTVKNETDSFCKRFGNDYYSFWWNGLQGIVLNTTRWCKDALQLDKEAAQTVWFKKQLEIGKLCSEQTIVFGTHSMIPTESEQEDDLSDTTREEMVQLLQEHKAGMYLGRKRGNTMTYECPDLISTKASEDNNDSLVDEHLYLLSTAPLCNPIEKEECGLHVVYVYRNSIAQEFYALHDVPETIVVIDQ